MTQQQVVGQVADGRSVRAVMPFNGDQELVLGRSEPGRARLLLAPVLETTQAHPEGQHVLEILGSWLRQVHPPELIPGQTNIRRVTTPWPMSWPRHSAKSSPAPR